MTKIYLHFKTILLIFVISTSVGMSQGFISFSDAEIKRGNKTIIKVESNGDFTNVTDIRIILKYNSYVIDIGKVTGNSDYIISCNDINLNKNFEIKDSATIEFSCNQINQNAKNNFFDLEIEGLAGPDSVAYIFIDSIFINNQYKKIDQQKNSKIKVIGIPVFQYAEGLGLPYPNPFYDKITIPFTLSNTSNIDFYIYSSSGHLIFDKTAINKEIIIKRENGPLAEIINLSKPLLKGTYKIEFTPVEWNFSTGLYYFFLKTDRNDYYSIFLYAK